MLRRMALSALLVIGCGYCLWRVGAAVLTPAADGGAPSVLAASPTPVQSRV